MSHFKDVCVCGKVLRQCRCMGPKTVNVIRPCTHEPQPLAPPDPNSPHVEIIDGHPVVCLHLSHRSRYAYLPDALQAVGTIIAFQREQRRGRW